MAIARPRLTLDEFLKFPELEPPLEFEEGRVTQKVSPNLFHGKVQVRVGGLIDSFAEPKKLASAFTELRVTFGHRSYVPDVAVYRWERIPRTPDGRPLMHPVTPPDIAIEILSPDQTAAALSRRCRWYVDHGVKICLFIDPERRTVRMYRPDATVLLRGDDRIDLDDVLPGFAITVRELLAVLEFPR
jgi:Uma2 family endonuclease